MRTAECPRFLGIIPDFGAVSNAGSLCDQNKFGVPDHSNLLNSYIRIDAHKYNIRWGIHL